MSGSVDFRLLRFLSDLLDFLLDDLSGLDGLLLGGLGGLDGLLLRGSGEVLASLLRLGSLGRSGGENGLDDFDRVVEEGGELISRVREDVGRLGGERDV